MQVITTERVPVKIWTTDVEPGALEQLKNIAKLPFVFKHVAAMPDVHYGAGTTVGSVIATEGAVIPAAVGVDIGCGMMAMRFRTPAAALRPYAAQLRRTIEAMVPVGFNAHLEQTLSSFAWKGWETFPGYQFEVGKQEEARKKAGLQHGTLGGGNHFIELCEDDEGYTWAMLHSGSRGVGKKLADIHMKAAQDLCARYFIQLPDKNLAYLVEGTREFDEYIEAVTWAQTYAWENRILMMGLVRSALEAVGGHIGVPVFPEKEVHVHHNYVTKEAHFGRNVWVTRKGAVCARAGMAGIIPGSMGARSYITEGLGNPDSFHSSSHGAGRRMGRKEARRQFTTADLEAQTAGVDCRKDDHVLDELPGAYKDIDTVMANQQDLVKPVHVLKQFLCVKG